MTIVDMSSRSTSVHRDAEVGLIAGLRDRTPAVSIIMIGGTLATQGTSSAQTGRLWDEPYHAAVDATASSYEAHADEMVRVVQQDAVEETRRAVIELRRTSGLTWEQIADMLGVSRRSVHFWASGKPLSAKNEVQLLRTLEVIRETSRGTASATRLALLEAVDGISAFDMLKAEDFEAARSHLGPGSTSPQIHLRELNSAARASRLPPAPAQLVDAISEPLPSTTARGRGVRTSRSEKGDSD